MVRGQRSATRELLQRKPAAHPEVVVAGQTDRRMPAGQLHARVGFGAVADQISETPQLLGARLLDRVEHCLERVPVAVDVGDDRHLHVYSPLP